MSYTAEGVEANTQNRKAGRPQKFDHVANQSKLRERFPYIAPDVRAMLLNVIEANARHWWCEAGGSVQRFELLFNNEKHAEQ